MIDKQVNWSSFQVLGVNISQASVCLKHRHNWNNRPKEILQLISPGYHTGANISQIVGMARNILSCSNVVIGDLLELASVLLLVHSLRLLYHGSGLRSNLTHFSYKCGIIWMWQNMKECNNIWRTKRVAPPPWYVLPATQSVKTLWLPFQTWCPEYNPCLQLNSCYCLCPDKSKMSIEQQKQHKLWSVMEQDFCLSVCLFVCLLFVC